jgi:hypothetical protein
VALNVYVFESPGASAHSVTPLTCEESEMLTQAVTVGLRGELTPSWELEWSWRIPCQWIEVPLCCKLLRTVIWKVSPMRESV